jgi:hypothetical protein
VICKWVTNPFTIDALSEGCPFICIGSPIITASTFSLKNNLQKAMAVALGIVVNLKQ